MYSLYCEQIGVLVNKRLCIRKYPFMMDIYENYAAPLQSSEERKVFMRHRSYDDGKLAQGQPIDREANERKAGSRRKRKLRTTWRKFWFNENKNSVHVDGSREERCSVIQSAEGVSKGFGTYSVEVNVGSSLM